MTRQKKQISGYPPIADSLQKDSKKGYSPLFWQPVFQ